MSTASKFPLLKLPILCIEDILIQSHSFELIHFSFLSKRCHRIVNSLKTKFDGLYITVDKDQTVVLIGCGNESKGNWHFNYCNYAKDEQITRSIGGCEMKTCIIDGFFFSYVDENIQISVKAGIQYLMNLFKLPIARVRLFPDDISQSRFPSLVGFSHCEEIVVKGTNQMDHDELRDIIERITPTEILVLDIPIDESFHCDMKSKRLIIYNGTNWVKWKQLFNWKFAILDLRASSLQPIDLELFVIRWFQSNETELEYFCVLFEEPFGEFNFESLPLIPWSEKRRSHSYNYNENSAIDCSDGKDLFREDGLLATILIKPTFFHFCVWHNRFP